MAMSRETLPQDGDRDGPSLPAPNARTATAVAEQLRRAIAEGVYGADGRLPAERRLSEAFAVSRTTVREALRSLEHRGLVSRRVGSGTFVTVRPGSEHSDIAEVTSPLELIEVRIAMEPHMVRLATMHATLRDIESVADALDQLERPGIGAETFTRHDRVFHQAIAAATRNPLMNALYGQINHVRGHRQWAAMKDKVLTPESMAAYNREHRELLEALLRRDADRAVAVVLRHLDSARRQLAAA